MDNLSNIFRDPGRRDFLKWAIACGAMCRLGSSETLANEVESEKVKGIVRHRAMFWEEGPDKSVRCTLCPRHCTVKAGNRGYCDVRENRDGVYETLVYGALCSANVDPIEKKPLFHYLPGTEAFSVATAGCNIDCQFCQNWAISQKLPEEVDSREVAPDTLVAMCKDQKCPTIAYTYSEPTIFTEYMHDSAALARQVGIGSVMISNGYINEKPMRALGKQLSAVKIDFKAYSEKFYRDVCFGELKPVLATLVLLKELGIWFEMVNLVIPTLNDSPQEIEEMCKWVVKNLGPDVPLHFTRFHPTYRLTNLPRTPVSTVERCRDIALEAGIHYSYTGNVPTNPGENTFCHSCGEELISRLGFRIKGNRIENGKCPKCKTSIPGVWSKTE